MTFLCSIMNSTNLIVHYVRPLNVALITAKYSGNHNHSGHLLRTIYLGFFRINSHIFPCRILSRLLVFSLSPLLEAYALKVTGVHLQVSLGLPNSIRRPRKSPCRSQGHLRISGASIRRSKCSRTTPSKS